LLPGESESEPDAEAGKEGRDEASVDFKGVLDDEESIFGELEDGDE